MRRAALIVACGLLACGSSAARAQQRDFHVLGAGLQTCGAWTEARHSDDYDEKLKAAVIEEWVEGFVSALDMVSPAVNKGTLSTNSDGATGWLDNYCSAHPLDRIGDAAQSLVLELGKRGE